MIKKIIKKILNIIGYNISKIDNKYKKLSFNDIHKIKIDIDNPIFKRLLSLRFGNEISDPEGAAIVTFGFFTWKKSVKLILQ